MKRFVLSFFTLLSLQFSSAQIKIDKFSITFKNDNLEDAIKKTETLTPYRFYYDPAWINEKEMVINTILNSVQIETIIESILKNTELNFFLYNKKIILTLNSKINDKLPTNYFEVSALAESPNDKNEKPIFHQQYDSVNSFTENNKNMIVFIGRQGANPGKKTYKLSGTITNSETGKAEANVHITIKDRKTSTTTNLDGNYSIILPSGLSTIEINSLNRKKINKSLMIYDNGTFNIILTDKFNLLDEIFVQKKGRKKIETTVSGLVSIDIETIKNVPLILGERDILKIATTYPGIKTVGEGAAGFNVRGGKEDQNLILLDQAVLYNPQHFLGFFSAINPYTAKKADIYKGSIPADFGGRLSSVFDITTKNGNSEKFSGEGAVGPITSNLTFSTPIKKNKSSILFGGRATYSDWILKALDDPNLKDSQAGFYDGIVKYNNTLNTKNNLEVTAYYSNDRFSLSSDSIYKYNNRLLTVKWQHSFSPKSKADLIATNSEYKFNIDYNTPDINSFDFGYKISDSQLQLKMNYLRNPKHTISYGITSKFYAIAPGYQRPTKIESNLTPVEIAQEKALESALFFSNTYKFNDKLLVDIGLRYSYYAAIGRADVNIYAADQPVTESNIINIKHYKNNEVIKTYGGFEPRLAARYFITEDFSIKTGFDVTRQYVHLLSSNVTQSPTDTWKLSNANIAPQSAEQISLGLFKGLQNDEYEISLEGYFKKSKNILDYKVGAQLLLNKNIETELLNGETKAYGIEFLIKKTVGKLNGWIGYTYSRALTKLSSSFSSETINNGNYFPANFDKPHDISAILNYKFTKRYSFSTNFLYQTGRPITYPIGTFQYGNADYTLYSDRNAFRIPDYIRLDIGLNIEGNHKIKKFAHSFWNISIYNVLGRNNPYSIYFITDKSGKINGYKTSIFSIPVPSITYNFKF